jgi:hypothetical protein
MKKYLLVLGYFFSLTYSTVFSKDQVTLRLSPGLAFGRVFSDPDIAKFTSNGIAFRGKVGAMYDLNIKDNYYLSAGLAFSAQQIGIKSPTIQEKHHIQYLQLPILLKLYTSELDLDLRGYAEIGFFAALKINDRTTDLKDEKAFINKLRKWGTGAVLGCGVEYSLSLFTTVFAGISYQLGFNSAFDEQRADSAQYKLCGYGDMITIDIGIGF